MGACHTHRGEYNAAHNAKTLPMAGAQFKQNHPEFVKPMIRCDAANAVGYSEWLAYMERSTFTRYDSFLPTIVPCRAATAPGPHSSGPRDDTL
jgi:hypothetical protein